VYSLKDYFFPNLKEEDIKKLKFKFSHYDNHIYFMENNEILIDIIKYAKYMSQPDSFMRIGKEMGKILKERSLKADLIAFVPMYRKDEIKRGFNQSFLLAKEISKSTNIPLTKKALKKTRKTHHQASLSKGLRAINLQGAFIAFDQIVAGKRVILVDDIFTSGATLKECEKELLKNQAKQVIFITIAKVLEK